MIKKPVLLKPWVQWTPIDKEKITLFVSRNTKQKSHNKCQQCFVTKGNCDCGVYLQDGTPVGMCLCYEQAQIKET